MAAFIDIDVPLCAKKIPIEMFKPPCKWLVMPGTPRCVGRLTLHAGEPLSPTHEKNEVWSVQMVEDELRRRGEVLCIS